MNTKPLTTNKRLLKAFNTWKHDNVSMIDKKTRTFCTQDAQYANRLIGDVQLYNYFITQIN